MNLGIPAHGFITWAGGIDFLGTIIDSLLICPRSKNGEFFLLVPDAPSPRERWRHATRGNLKGVFGPPASFGQTALASFRDRLHIIHLDSETESLARRAQKLNLDALIPACNPLGPAFPRPWAGYAYDFQHKWFPRYFTEAALRDRDEHFRRMLTEPRAVVVNSQAVAQDAARYRPDGTARIFALPFAPSPQPGWKDDLPEVLARYRIEPPFFLISNQFWAHKDHRTAFAAFRQLAGRRPLSLICTGSTEDPREPQHFPQLLQELKNWGLEARVRILGLIPKRDQIEIMKNACAVLQPTRFEGGPGGGAVYDAVALGIPCLVSDLPVNREIDCGHISFFPVGDSDALAVQMERILALPPPRPSWDELAAMGKRRRIASGETLWQAVDTVL